MNTSEVSRQSACFFRNLGESFDRLKYFTENLPQTSVRYFAPGRLRKSHCQFRGHALQLGGEPWQSAPGYGYPLRFWKSMGNARSTNPTVRYKWALLATVGSIIFNECHLQVLQWQRSQGALQIPNPPVPKPLPSYCVNVGRASNFTVLHNLRSAIPIEYRNIII